MKYDLYDQTYQTLDGFQRLMNIKKVVSIFKYPLCPCKSCRVFWPTGILWVHPPYFRFQIISWRKYFGKTGSKLIGTVISWKMNIISMTAIFVENVFAHSYVAIGVPTVKLRWRITSISRSAYPWQCCDNVLKNMEWINCTYTWIMLW